MIRMLQLHNVVIYFVELDRFNNKVHKIWRTRLCLSP